MSDAVRVRFAPSPTGMFHVGGARSALFNWALARQADGRFVLRIEDTDAERNRPEWVAGIITALAAIGISGGDTAFEGPYFQSRGAGSQREAALRLFAEGRAYYCDCTRDDLNRRTGSLQRGYDGYCRDRDLSYQPGRALRFRAPDTGSTIVEDVVRGRTEFPNSAMEDFVIARGDGTPVFVLANAVDDIREGITHVVRGEEHLSNTPKQQLLWAAFGAEPPVWAHLPVIVNEARQKLSKRRDKVALEDYLAEGYLPGALVNYLMLLGWGPRDGVEIRPFEELAALFRLADVSKAAAFFDVKKLAAFNGEYIRALSVDEFAGACQRWLEAPYAPWAPGQFDAPVFRAVAGVAQTRLTVLSEITSYVDWLFLEHPPVDEASWARAMKPGAEGVLASVRRNWAGADWAAEALRGGLEAAAAEHGLKAGQGAGSCPGRGDRPHRRASAVRVGRGAGPRAHAGPDRRRGGQAGRTGPGSSLTRRPSAGMGAIPTTQGGRGIPHGGIVAGTSGVRDGERAYGTGSGLRGHAPGGRKGARMTTMTYAVTGMTCEHCVRAVTAELSGLAGVSRVEVALVPDGAARVTVTSAAPLPEPAVAAALDEAGDYRLGPA